MYKTYKLGEICEIRSGRTPDTQKKEYWCFHKGKCDCIPWFTVSEITKQATQTNKKITQLAAKIYNSPLTTFNSVFYSKVRHIQPLYPAKEKLTCNEAVFILELKIDLISPNYLFYLLLSLKNKLYLLRASSVYPQIVKEDFINVSFSLPSLLEQNKILQKFQIVYNKLFQSEVIYNDFLLKMIKKCLELGDLLFLKYQNSTIKIKDHFKLVRGKTPPTKNPEYYEKGTIKWINSGVLTNLYFLTDSTPASKLVTEKAVQECQLFYAQPHTVLFSDIDLNPEKIVWVMENSTDGTHVWTLLGTDVWTLLGTDVYENSTLFFALRQIDFKVYASGSIINHLQGSALMNMKINWVSNPAKQKIFFTILNSKLAKIKDLHRKIKDLHRKIKDLLLLKYFGKKQK